MAQSGPGDRENIPASEMEVEEDYRSSGNEVGQGCLPGWGARRAVCVSLGTQRNSSRGSSSKKWDSRCWLVIGVECQSGAHQWDIITFLAFPRILSCTPSGTQVSLTS